MKVAPPSHRGYSVLSATSGLAAVVVLLTAACLPASTPVAPNEAADAGPDVAAPGVVSGSEPAAIAAPGTTLAIVGGRIIDGYGTAPIENGVILIAGERITDVGRAADIEIPAGVETVRAEGMTIMPGLFDMHVHLMILGHADYKRWDDLYADRMVDEVMPVAARQLLYAGVTSVRDVGANPDDILEVKRRIRDGEIPGPRLFVSGPFLQAAPYEPWERDYRWGITSVAQARQVVQDLARRGVDVIKLIDQDQMEDAVVGAIVDTAHDNGLPVVAHSHRMEEIRVGLRHGVDNFEHTGLGTAPGYADDVLALLSERNNAIYWTPTISALYTMQYTGEIFPERLDDPSWGEEMPAEMVDEIRQSLKHIPHLPYYALFPSRIPRLPTKFNQLRKTGVRMMIGTDSGIPTNFHNDSTWREMAVWVQLGVPAMEVIQAATLWPARFLGVEDDLGTLVPGRLADIIAVRGDPLTDMGVLSDVDVVIKGGTRVR